MSNTRVDIDEFAALVESAYVAALEPSGWQVFLRGIAEALDAKSGIFRVIDERAPAVRTNIHYNLDPDLQEAYRQYYVTLDAYVRALRDKPGVFIAPGEAILDVKAL